jgi:hypothetical protein
MKITGKVLQILIGSLTYLAITIIFNFNVYSQNQTKSRFIGTPIKVGNFEIAEFDFSERLNWKDAKMACEGLGKGWRLPTKNELDLIYRSKNQLKCEFKKDLYWSSTPVAKDSYDYWIQDFENGDQINYKYTSWISEKWVRAIKSYVK